MSGICIGCLYEKMFLGSRPWTGHTQKTAQDILAGNSTSMVAFHNGWEFFAPQPQGARGTTFTTKKALAKSGLY